MTGDHDARTALGARVTLDARMYPHIIGMIVDQASYNALLVLRRVSRNMRALADAKLCAHLVLRRPASLPGIYISTLLRKDDTDNVECELALPGFAFYPFVCDSPYNPVTNQPVERSHNEGRGVFRDSLADRSALEAGWSAWGPSRRSSRGASISPRRQFGFTRTFLSNQVAQAFLWCSEALKSVRTLDCHGSVPRQETSGLSSFLSSVNIARFYLQLGEDRPAWAQDVPCPHVNFLVTLGGHEFPQTSLCTHLYGIPSVSKSTRKTTVHVDLLENSNMCTLDCVGLYRNDNVREINTFLHVQAPQLSGNRSRSHLHPFGGLWHLISDAVLYPRATYTIVGFDSAAANALGIPSPSVAIPAETIGTDQSDSSTTAAPLSVKEHFKVVLEQFTRGVLEGGWTGRPWTQETVKQMAARVRLLSWDEWNEEVSENVNGRAQA